MLSPRPRPGLHDRRARRDRLWPNRDRLARGPRAGGRWPGRWPRDLVYSHPSCSGRQPARWARTGRAGLAPRRHCWRASPHRRPAARRPERSACGGAPASTIPRLAPRGHRPRQRGSAAGGAVVIFSTSRTSLRGDTRGTPSRSRSRDSRWSDGGVQHDRQPGGDGAARGALSSLIAGRLTALRGSRLLGHVSNGERRGPRLARQSRHRPQRATRRVRGKRDRHPRRRGVELMSAAPSARSRRRPPPRLPHLAHRRASRSLHGPMPALGRRLGGPSWWTPSSEAGSAVAVGRFPAGGQDARRRLASRAPHRRRQRRRGRAREQEGRACSCRLRAAPRPRRRGSGRCARRRGRGGDGLRQANGARCNRFGRRPRPPRRAPGPGGGNRGSRVPRRLRPASPPHREGARS